VPITIINLRDIDPKLRLAGSKWWRTTPELLYVGRAQSHLKLAASPWHNPYYVGSRLLNVHRYAERLVDNKVMLDKLPTLDGRVLVCWCAPLLCHAHVLKAAVELPETLSDYKLLLVAAKQLAKPTVW
jgi:hypothetical protein